MADLGGDAIALRGDKPSVGGLSGPCRQFGSGPVEAIEPGSPSVGGIRLDQRGHPIGELRGELRVDRPGEADDLVPEVEGLRETRAGVPFLSQMREPGHRTGLECLPDARTPFVRRNPREPRL